MKLISQLFVLVTAQNFVFSKLSFSISFSVTFCRNLRTRRSLTATQNLRALREYIRPLRKQPECAKYGFAKNWFENYTLKGGTYPYGHLRGIPTLLPGRFSVVLLSFSDFFVQKYLVDYQLLLQQSLQILKYLANKENKVPLEEQSKNPTPLPSCVQRQVQLRLGIDGRNFPPTN